MGRKSIAQEILDGITSTDDGEAVFMVAYDFRKMNASTRFYENLHRIAEKNPLGSSSTACT